MAASDRFKTRSKTKKEQILLLILKTLESKQ
jgi:hypothetical protein